MSDQQAVRTACCAAIGVASNTGAANSDRGNARRIRVNVIDTFAVREYIGTVNAIILPQWQGPATRKHQVRCMGCLRSDSAANAPALFGLLVLAVDLVGAGTLGSALTGFGSSIRCFLSCRFRSGLRFGAGLCRSLGTRLRSCFRSRLRRSIRACLGFSVGSCPCFGLCLRLSLGARPGLRFGFGLCLCLGPCLGLGLCLSLSLSLSRSVPTGAQLGFFGRARARFVCGPGIGCRLCFGSSACGRLCPALFFDPLTALLLARLPERLGLGGTGSILALGFGLRCRILVGQI